MSAVLPHEFPRRILFCVTGMSPQVLTETLYALIHAKPAFLPTEIHTLSTAEGAEQARLNLLSGEAHFHRFCKDYGYAGNTGAFDESHIHVITDREGKPLKDIITPQDNEAAADCISRHLQHLTSDPNAAVHVSLAGGRKTMGYYAGYALSLFARQQDRLSHVLVSQGFEGLSGFYYPTPVSRTVHGASGLARDAAKAEVMLAEIPFVRLRDGLPESLLSGSAGFSETVALAQRAEAPLSLEIDLRNQTLLCNGLKVSLPPARFAFYVWLATRDTWVEGIPKVSNEDPGSCNKGYAEELLEQLRALTGDSRDIEKSEAALRSGMSENYFLSTCSAVNKALRAALGEKLGKAFSIVNVGQRGKSLYGVTLDESAIKLLR